MTCSTQVGEEAAIEGSITSIGGWVAEESSAAPPGRFDTDAAVAQSTCNKRNDERMVQPKFFPDT